MLENLFVMTVLVFSGGYVFRRLWGQSQIYKKNQSCGGCSNSCKPTPGERTLPVR